MSSAADLVKCEVCDEHTHPREDGSKLCPKHYPPEPKKERKAKA